MTAPERPAWVPERLYPFRDHWLPIDGHQVHYIDEGSGPTLLMLHGQPTWSFLYRDIVKELRDSFRCVAVDYPGFGLSTAAAGYGFTPAEHAHVVERLVLELDLRGAAPIVQDWGGPIGLWVAGRHPDRFAGLVIGNTWAWPVDDDKAKRRFSKVFGGPVGSFLTRTVQPFVNVMIQGGIKKRKVTPEMKAAYRGPFPTAASREPQVVFPRAITAGRDFLLDVASGLPKLRDKPVLIVWGDRDIAFRARDLARFQELFPSQRTVMLAGAGHFIQEDAADEIAAAVRTWWREEIEGDV